MNLFGYDLDNVARKFAIRPKWLYGHVPALGPRKRPLVGTGQPPDRFSYNNQHVDLELMRPSWRTRRVNQPMAFSGCVAVADMAESSIDIAESLVGLSAATIFELHGEWRRLHRAPPPMRLSRDLLMRGITYKLQERPLGGLSTSIIRKLERLNLDLEASDAQKPARPISYERQAELGAHYPGREAPDRVGLPAGCLHDGPDGRALFALEHREHKGLL